MTSFQNSEKKSLYDSFTEYLGAEPIEWFPCIPSLNFYLWFIKLVQWLNLWSMWSLYSSIPVNYFVLTNGTLGVLWNTSNNFKITDIRIFTIQAFTLDHTIYHAHVLSIYFLLSCITRAIICLSCFISGLLVMHTAQDFWSYFYFKLNYDFLDYFVICGGKARI